MPEEAAAIGPFETSRSDLGLTVENPTPERLRFYRLPRNTEGALVTAVEPGSEAYRKNIREGFVIEKMGPNVRNLETIDSATDFKRQLKHYDAGDTILMLVRRDKQNTFFVAMTIPK